MEEQDIIPTASLVMNPDPKVLRHTDRITQAISYIMEHRFRSVPVVDDNECLVGLFGINCLLKQILPKAVIMESGLTSIPYVRENLADLHRRLSSIEDMPIGECVNRDCQTVNPDTSLMEVLVILYRTHTAIPVVEEETCLLKGMISYWDVGRAILKAPVE